MIVNKMPTAKRAQDVANARVVQTSFTYDGSAKALVVKYNGITLVKGTDYTVTGRDSATNAGQYTAKINGIGNYVGTKTVYWGISRAADSGTYTVSVNGTVVGTGSNPTCYARNLGADTDITVVVQYTFSHTMTASEEAYVNWSDIDQTDSSWVEVSRTSGVQSPSTTYKVRFSALTGEFHMDYQGFSKNYIATSPTIAHLYLYADAGT